MHSDLMVGEIVLLHLKKTGNNSYDNEYQTSPLTTDAVQAMMDIRFLCTYRY